MYHWHKRQIDNGQIRLTCEDTVSLAGCNKGVIPDELSKILSPSDNPPIGWTLPIADKWNKEGWSLIIDIKPKGNEVFLCELDRVYGYSYEEWSPIMLRLKLLYIEESKDDIDKNDFLYPKDPEIIYTMLYLYGSIKDGKLVGTWNPPFGSITALLFWPEAMAFFYEQVKQIDPYFITAETKFIKEWNKISEINSD
ncbi:MAG TPA: hypothetical protein VGN00_29305 [Puia sp.]|jgi:hypothetical protein